MKNISRYLSWNGFPKHIRKSILNRLKSNAPREQSDEELIKIYFRVPYAGIKGEQLVKSCIKKMKRFVKKNVRFIILYDTKKVGHYCSTKDAIPTSQKHNLVYEITCPGCGGKYIGKTDVCFESRMKQHGSKADQPMYLHFQRCSQFIETFKLLNILHHNVNSDVEYPSTEYMVNATISHSRIRLYNRNWSQLLFMEAYLIKKEKPSLNIGLKASRELVLFS